MSENPKIERLEIGPETINEVVRFCETFSKKHNLKPIEMYMLLRHVSEAIIEHLGRKPVAFKTFETKPPVCSTCGGDGWRVGEGAEPKQELCPDCKGGRK